MRTRLNQAGRRCVPVLLLACFAAVCPATAHDKSDVVTLDDGDTFHGEIKKLTQGTLTLKTANVGTISVKWSHVARLVSAFEFEVETTSGERHFGRLGEPLRAGELKIVGPAGIQILALADVFWLAPIEPSLWEKINGSVNFGFSYTQSNEAVQYSLSGDAHYLTRKVGADLIINSAFNTAASTSSAP